MRLVATYSMHYGPKGPMDQEGPVVERGEEFTVLPASQASAEEVGKAMIRNGVAVKPEDWAKRKKIGDINATWADDFCTKARAAYLGRQKSRGA